METLFDIGRLTENEAHEILDPHYEKLSTCITNGWDDYEEIIKLAPKSCIGFTPTTRANIVQNSIVENAKRLFSDTDGITHYYNDGLFALDFHGKIILRFKKLDRSLRPRNVKTGRQSQCTMQTLFDTTTIVTAGYRLDKTGTSIEDINVVCWFNNDKLWHLPLDTKPSCDIYTLSENKPTQNTVVTAKTGKRKNTERAERA